MQRAWTLRCATKLPALHAAADVVLAVLPRLLIQTPRGYLRPDQVYVPLMGLALLVGLWAAGDAWRERSA